MGAEFAGYTIYDHPKDHPEGFVVRRWTVSIAGAWCDAECSVAESLEAARRLVPEGMMPVPRFPKDDPVIVETWF
jgi:hypothetical protein